MAVDEGLIDWVAEAMAPVGRVHWRRMMGGATLYCDGTVFAIVAEDALWFKADGESDAEWDAQGCPRFSYPRADGTSATMNYRRAPDAVYDDADALCRWGQLGLAAGLRAPARKRGARKTRAGQE